MDTTHKDFSAFGLPEALIQDLTRLGFLTPTPIQATGIPIILGGKDLLAIAPTGTGKTGAFGIPALASLASQNEKQVLILAPTRELAAQIFQFIGKVALNRKVRGALLVGGESFNRQFQDCNFGVDYIVATPGRLMDHVSRGLDLKHVGILILDEIDRMLDMGFAPAIEEIVAKIPKERQTLFFSATIPSEIQKLAQKYLNEPVRITVGKSAEQLPKIREERIKVSGYEKAEALLAQVKSRTGKVLIFTRTKNGTDDVAHSLENAGIEAARLHGGRTQGERTRALDAFRRGRVRVLVATDIAARGLDVADIEVVINFDRAATNEDHVHRIGRTGRCGKEGVAITFVSQDRFEGRRKSRFQTTFRTPQNPDEYRNARAEAESNPRFFGKSLPPDRFLKTKKRDGFPTRGSFPKVQNRDGHSGSVRFFRNDESKSKPSKGRWHRTPETGASASKKYVPGIKRNPNGVVRRQRPVAVTN